MLQLKPKEQSEGEDNPARMVESEMELSKKRVVQKFKKSVAAPALAPLNKNDLHSKIMAANGLRRQTLMKKKTTRKSILNHSKEEAEKFQNQQSLLELKENEKYNLKKFVADAFRYAKNLPKEEADGDSSGSRGQNT